MNPVILFEPDGYLLTGRSLMGRHSAGNGFLRAAIAGRGEGPVRAYSPFESSAKAFREFVAEIDPAAPTEWIPGRHLGLIGQAGVIYRPDMEVWPMARERLRVGPGAYGICGVTHTLATKRTLEAVSKIPAEPMMPWDALVCTSSVALSVVTRVLDEAEALLRWRLRQRLTFERPMLPVIPLGVHTADFAFSAADRKEARAGLGLGEDTVAVLSAGRLSVGAKAHPYPMLAALQTAAEETERPLALVFAGQAYNAAIQTAYERAVATFCPSVRVVFVNGGDFDAYRRAWAAADVFISLADSIQETFGLTPIEAMAAGLPCLVSDWNGYKDTVRQGVDGFRIATWAPQPGIGHAIALDYEIGALSYDEYLYRCNTAVAVDMAELGARLRDLIGDEDLRRRMGAAGQARAREDYEWSKVYRRYQSLWAEQDALRRRFLAEPATSGWIAEAPTLRPDNLGPFDTFETFPTHHVTGETGVALARDLEGAAYAELVGQQVLNHWKVAKPVYEKVRDALRGGAGTVASLARATGYSLDQTIEVSARLAKIGILALAEPGHATRD